MEDGAAAFAMAEELVTREGRAFVHPFEGPNVTLATATVGLELPDSLAPPLTLPYSFGVCRDRIDELVIVEDDDLRRAMALIFHSLKLAVEPACAAAVAALTGPLRSVLAGKRVGLIFCGSNIDLATFSAHVRSVLQ